jgi:hypothetical protein
VRPGAVIARCGCGALAVADRAARASSVLASADVRLDAAMRWNEEVFASGVAARGDASGRVFGQLQVACWKRGGLGFGGLQFGDEALEGGLEGRA